MSVQNSDTIVTSTDLAEGTRCQCGAWVSVGDSTAYDCPNCGAGQ